MGKIEIVQDCTFQDLDVTGNINVSGTVDGVDVSAHVEDTSVHHTHANKTNLDALNQNVGTTGLPAFNGLTVNGDLTVTGRVTGAGYDPPNQSFLDAINQNLGTANAPAFAGITVNGDVAVTGKVDGVDVSAHAADNIIHHAHANKANIDTLNQNLGTCQHPGFCWPDHQWRYRGYRQGGRGGCLGARSQHLHPLCPSKPGQFGCRQSELGIGQCPVLCRPDHQWRRCRHRQG